MLQGCLPLPRLALCKCLFHRLPAGPGLMLRVGVGLGLGLGVGVGLGLGLGLGMA